MKHARRALLAASILAALPLIHGCATRIKASSTHNPAPATAFSSYGRIEMKPVAYLPGYKGNPAALGKIAANLEKDLAPSLQKWNSRPENGRSLIIEPVVEEMSFKSTGKRIMLGGLAGGSGVRMRVTFRDGSGKVVATPEFFQSASAMNGAWTMGATDNLMLTRVANLASGYIIANYDQAVGGPTGADQRSVAPN